MSRVLRVCELPGETIRNMYGCGCYSGVECYGSVYCVRVVHVIAVCI